MNEEVEESICGLSGSYWNYRWVKIVFAVPKLDDNLNRIEGEFEEEHYYGLYEVYYDSNGKPFMWSKEPEKLHTEDAKELIEFIECILDAAAKKVLLIKDGKIKELDEYMDKNEVLAKYRKEKKHGN
jgi:hypothetical protein